MIKGMGIDICQISRINTEISKRILAKAEQELFDQIRIQKKKIEFLAGRFCAKEAVYKALSGIEEKLFLRDIVILNDSSGKPFVDQPRYKDKNIFISISHEKDYAVAQAIVEEI